MNIDPMMLLALPVLLFAICVHETAHALVAFWGGDDTASLSGRLTLNPIAHIDPIGTILVPILGALSGFPLIGWAKPVPVNPLRLKNSTWNVYVSIAGPISNLLQAVLAFVLLFIFHLLQPKVAPYHFLFGNIELTAVGFLMGLLVWGILINIALAIFNLIPLPPLDGHWVVAHYFLRPGNALDRFYTLIQPFSYMVLLGLFYFFGRVFSLLIYIPTLFALNLIF